MILYDAIISRQLYTVEVLIIGLISLAFSNGLYWQSKKWWQLMVLDEILYKVGLSCITLWTLPWRITLLLTLYKTLIIAYGDIGYCSLCKYSSPLRAPSSDLKQYLRHWKTYFKWLAISRLWNVRRLYARSQTYSLSYWIKCYFGYSSIKI